MKNPKDSDPEFSAWSRRRFGQVVALGAGALVLPSLSTRAFADVKPTDPTKPSSEESELDQLPPHLRQIANDALAQLKYAWSLAAAGKASASGNELADACKGYLGTVKAPHKAGAEKAANQLLAAPASTRQAMFKQYATVAPATFSGTKMTALPKPAEKVSAATLEMIAKVSLPSAKLEDGGADKNASKKDKARAKDIAEGLEYKQIEFFLSEVYAVELTSGWGDDEIAMGGVGIGNTGNTEKIKQFRVKDEFGDDNKKQRTKVFKGGRKFASFEIGGEDKLPHEYAVTAAMAELDGGGFADFLVKLWDHIKGFVTAALVGGGTLAGTALGSIVPGLGNVIGAIIGAFIGWLLGFLQDDLVGSRTTTLRLHSVAKSYYEKLNLTKPAGMPVTLDYKGDGGHYKVTGGWRLVTP